MGFFSSKEKDKYKLVFDLSPEAIVILDLKGNVTDINGRVFDWLGFKPEEMIGKSLAQIPFLNKESLIRAQENFKKRLAGQKIPPYELDFVTKNGEKLVGRVTASQITNGNKKITGLLVMISDITRQKESEENLKESEEKYRQLVELAQEGIWLIDEKSITTFVNPRMAEILGYKSEEMIGKHLFSFMDEKEVKIAEEKLERRKKGIKEQHDFEFLKKDGSRVYTSLETSPIVDRDGRYIGALAVVADITQRRQMELKLKESEEKYRNIIDSSPDAITITDLNGKIVNCNQAALELYGFSKKEDYIGISSFNLISQKDHQQATKSMAKTLKERSLKNIEYTLLRKDGREFPGELSASVIYNDKNEPIFFMAITRDISERKRIDRAKSEFTSLASHQLRTPLSIMSWYTEMLLKGRAGALKKQQKKYLKEIYDANDNLIKLVNMLLNISRIDLGTFIVNPSKVDLIKVINKIIKNLSFQVKEKKLKIEKKYPEKPFLLDTDQNIMNIVLQNLLSNAIRYTSDKGKITISIRKQGSFALIEISDTGYGIPEDQQSQIFSRFFRAENIKRKDTSGIGLGLYIAKSVIEQIKGEISFKSEENKGTNFYVKIPLELSKKSIKKYKSIYFYDSKTKK